MRRILMVLAAAVVMALMIAVAAVPAFATNPKCYPNMVNCSTLGTYGHNDPGLAEYPHNLIGGGLNPGHFPTPGVHGRFK